MHVFCKPSPTSKMWHKVNSIQNSPWPVAIQRLKSPYTQLFTHSWRIVGWIHFPRALSQLKMQTNSSWIWTRFTVFISNKYYDYTTCDSCRLVTRCRASSGMPDWVGWPLVTSRSRTGRSKHTGHLNERKILK